MLGHHVIGFVQHAQIILDLLPQLPVLPQDPQIQADHAKVNCGQDLRESEPSHLEAFTRSTIALCIVSACSHVLQRCIS
jgi:hypothetical protein